MIVTGTLSPLSRLQEMSMGNFDADIIFDLGAGRWPVAEARELEDGLSVEARAELETQRSLLATIAEVPEPAMTDLERARLHQSVAETVEQITRELEAHKVMRPPRQPRTRARAIRWMRLAYGAAAALLVVGVVAVGSQLGVRESGKKNVSDTTITPTALDTQAATAPESVEGHSVTKDTLTTDTTADGQLFAVVPPISSTRSPNTTLRTTTSISTTTTDDQYIGVTYSDEAQFDLSSFGGWLFEGPKLLERGYGVSHLADGGTHMLWLLVGVDETGDGRTIWEVLDVISFPEPWPSRDLAISGCIGDSEGFDEELHGLAELNADNWTLSRVWRANRAEARWEEIPVDGLVVHPSTGACELGYEAP